jgi:hypothetical protein
MVDRRGVARAAALGAGVALAGATASVAVAAILVAGDAALSPWFYRTSAAAVVPLHAALGALAGRRAAPRLRRAGMAPGRSLYALAAVGPVAVALLAGPRPVGDIPHPVSALVPAFAAAAGAAAMCVRREGRRPAGDTGAGAVDYIVVVLLVAGVAAMVTTSGAPAIR